MSTLKTSVIAASLLMGLVTGIQARACPTMFFFSGYHPYSWSGQSVYTPLHGGYFSLEGNQWSQPILFSDGTETISVRIATTFLSSSENGIKIGYDVSSAENQALVGKYFDFLLSADINWESSKILGATLDPRDNFTRQVNGSIVEPNGFMLDVNNLRSFASPNPGFNPDDGDINFSVDFASTPEPSTLLLLGTGLMALFAVLLRRQKYRV